MKTNPMPTTRTRRVKAWVIINKHGGVEYVTSSSEVARLQSKLFACKYPQINGSVFPCTITYQLPKTKKKGKKK